MSADDIRVLAVVLACAAFSSASAQAAPMRARLTVDVQIDGTETVVGTGADRTTGTFREGFTLVTYLGSDGELAQFDTKDPEYAQKMMGLAAGVHQKVLKAQGKPAAKKMTLDEFKAYMQKQQAACAGDQACMYKLAKEAQALSANLDTGASAKTPAYSGDEPPRFLSYFGYENCGAKAHVYVDRTLKGTLADTTGAVPYSIHHAASYDSNVLENQLICNQHQAIVDTKTATFRSDGVFAPGPRGLTTTIMRGKTEKAEGEITTHGAAYTWVAEQLRQAPRSGVKTGAIKLTQNQGASIHSGKYTGEARITLTWKLEDVK